MYWNRNPQWQKSEEIINVDVGSARYGASIAPYPFSTLGDVLPTRIGIIGGYEEGEEKVSERRLWM